MMTYDEAIKKRGELLKRKNLYDQYKKILDISIEDCNNHINSISGYINILEQEKKEVTDVSNEA